MKWSRSEPAESTGGNWDTAHRNGTARERLETNRDYRNLKKIAADPKQRGHGITGRMIQQILVPMCLPPGIEHIALCTPQSESRMAPRLPW